MTNAEKEEALRSEIKMLRGQVAELETLLLEPDYHTNRMIFVEGKGLKGSRQACSFEWVNLRGEDLLRLATRKVFLTPREAKKLAAWITTTAQDMIKNKEVVRDAKALENS